MKLPISLALSLDPIQHHGKRADPDAQELADIVVFDVCSNPVSCKFIVQATGESSSLVRSSKENRKGLV